MIKFTEIIHESLQYIDVQRITAREVIGVEEISRTKVFSNKDELDKYVANKLGVALGCELVKYLPIKERTVRHRSAGLNCDEIQYRVDCIVFKDFNELEKFAVALIGNYLSWGGKILKEKEDK